MAEQDTLLDVIDRVVSEFSKWGAALRILDLSYDLKSPVITYLNAASSKVDVASLVLDRNFGSVLRHERLAVPVTFLDVRAVLLEISRGDDPVSWSAAATAGERQFELIVMNSTLHAITTATGLRSASDDNIVNLFRFAATVLAPDGVLLVSETFAPPELEGPTDDSNGLIKVDALTSHTWTPKRLIRLATQETHGETQSGQILARPLLQLKRESHVPADGTTRLLLADIDRDDAGRRQREVIIALERSRTPFRPSDKTYYASSNFQAILELTANATTNLRDADDDAVEYGEALSHLLADDNETLPVYRLLARSLYAELESSFSPGLPPTSDVEIWLAYESIVAAVGRMPARDSGRPGVQIHGYSFRENSELRDERTIAKCWLNIILNAAGYAASQAETSLTLHPPTVHDWLVAESERSRGRDPSPTALTVYVDSIHNRRSALLAEFNTSPHHHSLQLLGLPDSNAGEFWGYQLAGALDRMRRETPDGGSMTPWPYDDRDTPLRPTTRDISVATLLRREGSQSWQALHSGEPVTPGSGWLRAVLYSLFLTGVLTDEFYNSDTLPLWVTDYMRVLERIGHDRLHDDIRHAIDVGRALWQEAPSVRWATSLSWLAPPLVTTPGGTTRSLGSVLILADRILPVNGLSEAQEMVFASFLAVRNAEALVAHERQASRISKLEGEVAGIDLTIDGFSHEIARLTTTIFEEHVRPVESVFSIEGRQRLMADPDTDWIAPAGTIVVADDRRDLIATWKICERPYALQCLSDVLFIWASSSVWRTVVGLDTDSTFAAALQRIIPFGIRAGIATHMGATMASPQSFAELQKCESLFREAERDLTALMGAIHHVGAPLRWRGDVAARVPQCVFSRMLTAALCNAVYHMDTSRPPLLEMQVTTSAADVDIRLFNSARADFSPKDAVSVGTRSVLRSCLQYLRGTNELPPDSMYFDRDRRRSAVWLTRVVVPTKVPQGPERRLVSWLGRL